MYFYPRSPRGERPYWVRMQDWEAIISIHAPREGSDTSGGHDSSEITHFYPRSPRGERHRQPVLQAFHQHFYPRSPRGERRRLTDVFFMRSSISIHAPREGSDRSQRMATRRRQHFYPRSPRGERLGGFTVFPSPTNFYPRSPRGERPAYAYLQRAGPRISIHAPREGSDSKCAEK